MVIIDCFTWQIVFSSKLYSNRVKLCFFLISTSYTDTIASLTKTRLCKITVLLMPGPIQKTVAVVTCLTSYSIHSASSGDELTPPSPLDSISAETAPDLTANEDNPVPPQLVYEGERLYEGERRFDPLLIAQVPKNEAVPGGVDTDKTSLSILEDKLTSLDNNERTELVSANEIADVFIAWVNEHDIEKEVVLDLLQGWSTSSDFSVYGAIRRVQQVLYDEHHDFFDKARNIDLMRGNLSATFRRLDGNDTIALRSYLHDTDAVALMLRSGNAQIRLYRITDNDKQQLPEEKPLLGKEFGTIVRLPGYKEALRTDFADTIIELNDKLEEGPLYRMDVTAGTNHKERKQNARVTFSRYFELRVLKNPSFPEDHAVNDTYRGYSVVYTDEKGEVITPESQILAETMKKANARVLKRRSSIQDLEGVDLSKTDDHPLLNQSMPKLQVEQWLIKKKSPNALTEASEIDLSTGVVLLNFWEPWCGPCIEKMPKVDELQKRYKNAGLRVFSLSKIEGDEQNHSDNERIALEHLSLTFARVSEQFIIGEWDDETLKNGFGVKNYPTSVVLNNGKVVWYNSSLGADANPEPAIQQALEENALTTAKNP